MFRVIKERVNALRSNTNRALKYGLMRGTERCKGMVRLNHKLSVRLNTRDYDAVNLLSRKCGVTSAFVIRVALRRYLVEKGAYQNENR